MKKEIKSTLKKTAKITGVTCVAAGAVAILTSSVALKTICQGGKHLAARIKGIVKEDVPAQEIPAEDTVMEESLPREETEEEIICEEQSV